MKNRKLKTSVKLIIICVILLGAFGIWKITANKPKEEHPQVNILEDNGNLEIQIPEDQESGGF